jgi:hypothetical protein
MLPALKSVVAVATAAFVIGLSATEAGAVDDRDCRDYATAAIRQVHQMHEFAACNRGQGTRWSDDWNVHYQWCRSASPDAIGAERNARTNWLRSCEKR